MAGRRRARCRTASLALLVAVFFSDSGWADPVEQGREVYGEFCVNCHGRDMVAVGAVSFDLRKFPRDDFERFRNAVLNGKGPAMPPWRGKVSDEDLADLWAYVRSGG